MTNREANCSSAPGAHGRARLWKPLAASALLLSTLALRATPARADVYADPNGTSNTNCTAAQPCTLEAAQTKVQTLNTTQTTDILVYLNGGTYARTSTLAFGPADSGMNGHKVIWQATTGQTPVLSGGATVPSSSWSTSCTGAAAGVWCASLTSLGIAGNTPIRQVYVNGTRMQRARTAVWSKAPAGISNYNPSNPVSFTEVGAPTTVTGFTSTQTSLASLTRKTDIEVWKQIEWMKRECPVSSITSNGTVATIDVVSQCLNEWNSFNIDPQYYGTAYWLENNLAFLNYPGQWYYNPSTQVLYYMPLVGQTMTSSSSVQVTVPVFNGQLLTGVGTSATAQFHDVTFQGITFSYNAWNNPSTSQGFVEVASNEYAPDATLNNLTYPPAAISLKYAKGITFSSDVVSHVGAMGLQLQVGSVNNTVDGSVFSDISGGAMLVGVEESTLKAATDSTLFLTGNTITNNVITEAAADYSGGIGIFAEFAKNTNISNNTLSNLPYRALSTGGEFLSTVRASSTAFTLNNNQVYNAQLVGRDTGVIDTLARNDNSTVSGNYIYGDTRTSPLPDQSFPFYLEAGSYNYLVNNNVFIQAPRYDADCTDPDSTPHLPAWMFINDFYGTSDPTVQDPSNNTIEDNYFFPQVTPTANGICHAAGGTALTNNTYAPTGHPNTRLTSLTQSSWPTAAQNIVAASGVGSTYTGLLLAQAVNVDDTVTGTGSNQFNYTGTGWGSCTGTATCGDPTGNLYNDSNSFSATTSDSVTFTFSGTRIDLYGVVDPGNGIGSASIDGGAASDVDFYNATRQGNVPVFTSGPLTAGSHTLTLTVTGRKNAASTGYYISVDRAAVLNTAPQPSTVDDSVQGTGLNQFNYVGASWGHCLGVSQCGTDTTYNNSDSWATTTGDYVLFKFTGTQVKFYGVNDTPNQMLGLSICDANGANCGTETVVDQYAATRQGNVLQWTSPVQTSGTYTLKARVTGQHNPSAVASGGLYYGTVDRADVVP